MTPVDGAYKQARQLTQSPDRANLGFRYWPLDWRKTGHPLTLDPVLDPSRMRFYKTPLRGAISHGEADLIRWSRAEWQSGDAADCKSVYVGSIPASASRNWSGVAQRQSIRLLTEGL